MSAKTRFERKVDSVHLLLERMLEAHRKKDGVDSNRWLELLFKHYSDRMLSDNERIWRTGALLIPISLAAFAALAGIKCLMPWHVLTLAVPAITLIAVWLVLAENHRAFQQNSEAWLVAIARTMDLKLPGELKLESDGPEGWLVGRSAVQKMRWTLALMVIAMWALMIAASMLGFLPSQCGP